MTDHGTGAERADRQPVVLGPGEGRPFPMGPLSASFKPCRALCMSHPRRMGVSPDDGRRHERRTGDPSRSAEGSATPNLIAW